MTEDHVDPATAPEAQRTTPPADDEHTSDSSTCPNCGQPVENVRRTCPNCRHEYSQDEYDQPRAGSEFTAGSEVDDAGREIVDDA